MKAFSIQQTQVHAPIVAWLLTIFDSLVAVVGLFAGGSILSAPTFFWTEGKQKQHLAEAMDFTLENGCHAPNGLFRISAQQTAQQHVIDIQTVNLLAPRFH